VSERIYILNFFEDMNFVKILLLVSLLFLENIPDTLAEEKNLLVSLFVDTYSAYSDNKIANEERHYFTQASRNKDIHLNLASIGLKYDNNIVRATLAGQYGDSVSINYNAEPQDSFKYIQESYAGYYLGEKTYVDVGTFLSHIGAESFRSIDNLNYTRSFIAEFSPYYETGIRLSHAFNNEWSAQLLGLNGWQNTSDSRHPALGTQVLYTRDNITLTSNTFLGNENKSARFFHDFIASLAFESGTKIAGSIDVGRQYEEQPGTWWGYALMAKKPLSSIFSVNGRFEYYNDPSSLIVTSVTESAFKAYGTSFGLDASLGYGLSLRSEVKHIWSKDAVFLNNQDPQKEETLLILSLNFLCEQAI
jgi:hypothetical protein